MHGAPLPHGARYPAFVGPCGERPGTLLTLLNKRRNQPALVHVHSLAVNSSFARLTELGAQGENAAFACLGDDTSWGGAPIAAFSGEVRIHCELFNVSDRI